MTLLGFKRRFVTNVLAGYVESAGGVPEAPPKRHSIRALPKSGVCRFKVGDQVQLYTDVRQKTMHKIIDRDPVVTKIEAIEIHHYPNRHAGVIVAQKVQYETAIEELAQADGFPDAGAFLDFFAPNEGDGFAGHIIHWDWK